MNYGYILERVEDGFKQWLDTTVITGSFSGSAPVTTYKGMDDVDKLEANSLIIFGESAQQIEYGMNIYECSVNITYRYCPDNEYETSINTRNATYKLITETLFNNDLQSKLTQFSTGLKIFDVETEGTANNFDGSSWQSSLSLKVVCGIFNQ